MSITKLEHERVSFGPPPLDVPRNATVIMCGILSQIYKRQSVSTVNKAARGLLMVVRSKDEWHKQ